MRVALLLAAAAAGLALAAAGGKCNSNLDCWLNGDCTNGLCDCDAAWDGDNCEILAELPSTQIWPNPSYPQPSNVSTLASSWDATMIEDENGVFHAYFNVVCANFTWMHVVGAVIVHTTGPSRSGPFTFSDVALAQQSFNPHITRLSDGSYVIAHQASGPDPTPTPLCTGDYPGTPVLHPWEVPRRSGSGSQGWAGVPALAHGRTPSGPWAQVNLTLPMSNNFTGGNWNPSLLPLGNASSPVLLAYTAVAPAAVNPLGYASTIAVATAPAWDDGSQYTLYAQGSNGGMTPFNVSAEDPFLWRDSRGFHLVFHRMAWGANGTWVPGSGGLAVSLDGQHWTACPTPIYTTDVVLEGVPTTFRRRERPEIQFDSASGAIVGLLTGAERVVQQLGVPSISLYTPVRTSKP